MRRDAVEKESTPGALQASRMSTRRCAARQPAASLGALVAVCLLRCSGAFFAPSPDARKGTLPGNKPTGHESLVAHRVVVPDTERSPRGTGLFAFGGVSVEWDRAEDRTASFAGAVVGASSSFVAGEAAFDDDGEQERRGVMTLASARRGADGGGATAIEASGTGGGRGVGEGWWRRGFRKAGRAVPRVLQRGDSAAATGVDQVLIRTATSTITGYCRVAKRSMI